MIPLLVGVFVVILFIVTIVLSASTWRAWHIVAACLTFLAALGLLVVGSMSVKTHLHWRKQYDDLTKQLAAAQRQGLLLERGDPLQVEPPRGTLSDWSVRDLQIKLDRLMLDRGRVWRRCTPGVPAAGGVQVSTVPPMATGEPGDPSTAPANGISANTVLYAFIENENRHPIAFLGEFHVVDAQPASVTLQPTLPLDGQQQALVAVQPAFWTLYETMPVDAHFVFSNDDPLGKRLADTPEPVFGVMDEAKLREVFSAVTLQPAESDLVTMFIEPYLKDGRPATEDDVNRYPDNVWRKLEFQVARTEQVDSDNPDTGLSGSAFDAQGLAQASQLRLGDKAALRVKDIGLFSYAHDDDKRQVDSWITEGVCTNLGPYYVRSLRDYRGAFHDHQARFMKCLEDTRRAQRDVAALQLSIEKVQAQTTYRQDERLKLQHDRDGVERDRTQLTALASTMAAQQTGLSEELSNLFQTNLALDQQLTLYNTTVTDEINRRTAAVAAAQTP
ncbi:MAG: hypothetical protein MUF48_08810 [Pirellulaceae bacterium]|jgi:hypothetical protein|nr:hypothetical protein [Pirellulaceae bacterium]